MIRWYHAWVTDPFDQNYDMFILVACYASQVLSALNF